MNASIRALQHFLSQHFEMKSSILNYFHGLEVTSSSCGYCLSQTKYVFGLLFKTSLTNNKIISTPLEFNAKLVPLDGEPISDATHYLWLVYTLIYLTVTHLAISHVISIVNKFMDAPRSIHYDAILEILTLNFIMVFTTPFDFLSSFMLIQMSIGQVILLANAPSQVFTSC